jgi:hypothetical protein
MYVNINIQITSKMDAVFPFETLTPKYRTIHHSLFYVFIYLFTFHLIIHYSGFLEKDAVYSFEAQVHT